MYLKEPPTTMRLEPVTDYIRRVVFCDRLRGGAIFHLSRGRRDQTPEMSVESHQADPRMVDTHQVVPR